MNDSDRNFLTMIMRASHAQTEISSISSYKTEDESIKDFSRSIGTYHQSCQTELAAIANLSNYSLPSYQSQAYTNTKNSFSQLSGRLFDSAYVCFQIKHHLGMINLCKNEISNGRNKAIKTFAAASLRHLRMQLNRADSLSQLFLSTYLNK